MNRIIPGFLLLCIFFAACQKEMSFDDPLVDTPTDTTVTTNDSILLQKLIYLDTTLPHPNDTLSVYQFSYNARKKPTEIILYGYDNGAYFWSEKHYYTYTGTDTLPSKIVLLQPGFPSGTDTFNMFYTYNAQGLVNYDSTIFSINGPPYVNIRTYDYSVPGKVREGARNFPLANPSSFVPGLFREYTQVTSAGNIINEATTTNWDTYIYKYACTYDNHVNPVKAAFNRPFQIVFFDALFGTVTESTQKNNVLNYYAAEHLALNGNLVEEFRASLAYKYNANNYPVSAVVTDLLGNYPSGNKMVFTYTR